MESLRKLFRIGSGPSSSHTIGPERASNYIIEDYPLATSYKVTLFGSLALTGKGHLTDKTILKVLGQDRCKIFFDYKSKVEHPNTMRFDVYKDKELIASDTFISIGGGSLIETKRGKQPNVDIYDVNTFNEVKNLMKREGLNLPEVVYKYEDKDIKEYLYSVWNAMEMAISRGLSTDGILPGGLKVHRKAKAIFESANADKCPQEKRLIMSYAYAVSEENASGGTVVTAPTCGASGIVPACLYNLKNTMNLSKDDIIDALAVAGLIGNIVKKNASISGALAGCQSEVGTACSMAASMIAYLKGLDINHIEAAAEIAMEHHLGLTCDPVKGLVQIPCIERNAVAAMRAIDAADIASLPIYPEKLSFDEVVKTMYQTGRDLKVAYRETAKGGLAKSDLRED